MGTTFDAASRISRGCSSRHDTHHDAHTLSSHTFPLRSEFVSVCEGCCSCVSANDGAGLPMSGEGTSRGSRHSPTYKNATRMMKIANGIDQRTAFISIVLAFNP